MRYVVARLDEFNREMTYRFYISSSLQLAPQNKHITKSLYDLLYNYHPEEEKTGDEIVEDIMLRAGLTF